MKRHRNSGRFDTSDQRISDSSLHRFFCDGRRRTEKDGVQELHILVVVLHFLLEVQVFPNYPPTLCNCICICIFILCKYLSPVVQNLCVVCRLPCNVPIKPRRASPAFSTRNSLFRPRSLARHRVNDYVSLSDGPLTSSCSYSCMHTMQPGRAET